MKIKDNFDIQEEYRGDNASALAEELYLEQQKKKESKEWKAESYLFTEKNIKQ